MYTAVVKFLSNNKEQITQKRKFFSRKNAIRWAEKMWRKHPVCVVQVNGKGFYTCLI